MSDPSLALQGALVAALKGVTDAGQSVFDRVPPEDPFPRITIGEGQTLSDNADCRRGSEVFLEVHVWSRAVGFRVAKRIAEQVRNALDDNMLTLDGHVCDYLAFDSSQFLRDPDGITNHVAMTFRALTQPDI